MRHTWPQFFALERQLKKLGASPQLARSLACRPLPRAQAARLLALAHLKENIMAHNPTCSGCPSCNPEMRSLLSMSPEEYCRWLTEQDRKDGLRSASSRGTLRVSHEPTKTEGEWRDEMGRRVQGFGSVVTSTPDAYAKATEQAPRAPCPFDDPNYAPHGTPPDGYAIAIEQVKKGSA